MFLNLCAIQCYKGIAPLMGINATKAHMQGCSGILAHNISRIHIDALGDTRVCQGMGAAGVQELIQCICTDRCGNHNNLVGCIFAPLGSKRNDIFHDLRRRKAKILHFQHMLIRGILAGCFVERIFDVANFCRIFNAFFHQNNIPKIKYFVQIRTGNNFYCIYL